MKAQTKYTKSGRINIAYQVIGDGPIDIVYIPGWVSNIDLMWECPQLVAFLEGLNKFARVILFDKRGTGLSDRMIELSSLEERMDDIRAVMDAVGSKRAALFGHSEGGSVSALFAATYPERTLALLTFGVFAKRSCTPDYPWAPTAAARQAVYEMIETKWGSGDMDLVSLAPSMKDDHDFMDWLARYFRSGASPSAALALTKMNTDVDIIDILDTIEVPALLMCRTNDIDAKVEESKFMASRIRGAKFVEFEGDDHLFWAGETGEVLEEITNFMADVKPIEDINRMLSTILFTEVLSLEEQVSMSTGGAREELNNQYNDIVQKYILQYRGKVIKNIDDRYMATFDGPSKAVHCSIAIRDATEGIGIHLNQGIHTGECIMHNNGDIGGMAVRTASRVQKEAGASVILITQTVKNLLSGSGLDFEEKGAHQLKDIPDPISILSVVATRAEVIALPGEVALSTIEIPKNHSILENVLQSIESHMSDENYGLDDLCAHVGLSERQLQRKLKLIANKSPNQMIRSVRLHKAKEILLHTEDGVSQAAYKTGFGSLSYFTKCFRKEFGVAPTEVR